MKDEATHFGEVKNGKMDRAREIAHKYKLAHEFAEIRKVLNGASKSAATMELLGCDREALWKHLEALFLPGMTRENHGLKGWHVDHIFPCAEFDLADPQQQRECFHYTNLQPLWASDNIRKGAKSP